MLGPKTGNQEIRNWLKAHSEISAGLISLALVALLAFIDFRTPPEIKLTLFYLLIISFAAWCGGKRVAITVVMTSSLILRGREFKLAGKHSLSWASFWNTSVSSRVKVHCCAECEPSDCVHETAMAIHLYRIAQEAVNNAVKHSKASSIRIRLGATGDRVELRIADDGVGIPLSPVRKGGMGLHIMEYRARMIGGTLTVGRGGKGGTVVSCVATQSPI